MTGTMRAIERILVRQMNEAKVRHEMAAGREDDETRERWLWHLRRFSDFVLWNIVPQDLLDDCLALRLIAAAADDDLRDSEPETVKTIVEDLCPA